MPFTVEDKIACLKRELLRRRRVYPGLVMRHRMSRADTNREIELLSLILSDYEVLLADMKPDLFLPEKAK